MHFCAFYKTEVFIILLCTDNIISKCSIPGQNRKFPAQKNV